jgi:hypothetical protein
MGQLVTARPSTAGLLPQRIRSAGPSHELLAKLAVGCNTVLSVKGVAVANMAFMEAFAAFGAKPVNPMWAVSAIADDGALVLSCWAHICKPGGKGVLLYKDTLSRWGGNEMGCNLLRTHLKQALLHGLPVRMVVATTAETEAVDSGQDASKVKKTFHIRPEVIGRVTSFDGDQYVIEYRRAT